MFVGELIYSSIIYVNVRSEGIVKFRRKWNTINLQLNQLRIHSTGVKMTNFLWLSQSGKKTQTNVVLFQYHL